MEWKYRHQQTKDTRKNNDLQNITQKTKDRATGTPLKTGDELLFSGREGSSCSTCVTDRVTLVTNPVISHE
jgi:hypothetical protein